MIHHMEIVKSNMCILFLYLRYLIFNLSHINVHVYARTHAPPPPPPPTHTQHSFMDVVPTGGINL